jgi:hypothetical protein
LEISLGHVLAEMEDAAHWFRQWPLPEEVQRQVMDALEDLHEQIRELAAGLGLSPVIPRPDPMRKLRSEATHWWTTILDCRSQVLRAYGELNPAVGPRLDPRIQELAASILALESLGRG